MVNLLPAVIVGGPPHIGKSVLFYNLARALREQGIHFHAIRACPDGEGNWSQEVEQELAQEIRVKGDWTDEFTERVSRDIEQRLLPMLIDVGGKPQGKQYLIFQHCTHAILLLPHEQERVTFWQQVVEQNGLLLLAQLYSELNGISTLHTEVPVIRGTISGLQRGTLVQNNVFEVLVEHIATLFRSYEGDLKQEWLYRAPAELAISLDSSLQAIAPTKTMWEPTMIPHLLGSLPAHTPLSVYGPGPQWLYAALAAYALPQSFYQFDPRLGEQGGWIEPPVLSIAAQHSPTIDVHAHVEGDVTVLRLLIQSKHLDYLQSNGLPFPPVPGEHGVILDGSIPSWLATALVRLYVTAGVTWVGCHAVREKGAVVVYSCDEAHRVGDVIAFHAV